MWAREPRGEQFPRVVFRQEERASPPARQPLGTRSSSRTIETSRTSPIVLKTSAFRPLPSSWFTCQEKARRVGPALSDRPVRRHQAPSAQRPLSVECKLGIRSRRSCRCCRGFCRWRGSLLQFGRRSRRIRCGRDRRFTRATSRLARRLTGRSTMVLLPLSAETALRLALRRRSGFASRLTNRSSFANGRGFANRSGCTFDRRFAGRRTRSRLAVPYLATLTKSPDTSCQGKNEDH